MKKNYFIVGITLLILSIIAAFSVPIIQIVKYQSILDDGEEVKMKLKAFDPYDAFRGRFINIDLDFGSYKLPKPAPRDKVFPTNSDYRTQFPVNIILEKDKDGFAYIKELSFDLKKKYPDDAIIMRGRIRYWDVESESRYNFSTANITALNPRIHIDRFYMNESLAPEAEKALNNAKIREKAYALIKIKDKIPVIENIYIGDEDLADFLEN